MRKPKALYCLGSYGFESIYGPSVRSRIAGLVDIPEKPFPRDTFLTEAEGLSEVEFLLTGWEGPHLDGRILEKLPGLRAVFHGAGSIRGTVTDAFWEKDLPITSSYSANAVPVVEFTLSQILFCLKKGWQHAREVRKTKSFVRLPVSGNYRSRVGILSLGMIGRMVCQRLQAFDLEVVAWDPVCPPEVFAGLDVPQVSLEEIFETADLVSVHTPLLDSTRGFLGYEHFSRMKQGATLLNTARGALIREEDLARILKERSDLFAFLDVTFPEPPAEDSPFYTLPNVVVTPHIAGSMDRECERMGDLAASELERFLRGEPLQHRISREQAAAMA